MPPANIIGGMFGLQVDGATGGGLHFGDRATVLLANARGGLRLLAQSLRPKQVWLPSYLCGDMLLAFEGLACKVDFYEIDAFLRVPTASWMDSLLEDDLVVAIDYFGFPTDPIFLEAVQARRAWIVEDSCQALLTERVGEMADFVLYSPRKFLGVPDGGVLCACSPRAHRTGIFKIPLRPPPQNWWFDALTAAVWRRDFDLAGNDPAWFALFQQSEKSTPVEPYAMSELAQTILLRKFSPSKAITARRINYQYLLGKIGHIALFPDLPAGVVPLGFPVRCPNRGAVRKKLFDNKIFPPIHWFIDGIVPNFFKASHQLAREIMTLPCDQRYTPEDMARVADCLLDATAEYNK